MKIVNVILPLPLEGTFTYLVPEELQEKVKVGMRVIVPLGRSKQYTAIVESEGSTVDNMKPIVKVMDDAPVLLPEQMKLWRWMAEYYMCPLGDIYKAALPGGMKQEEGYRPKTETYVRLTETYRNEQALHIAMDMLKRASKQLKVLVTYLSLSHWDTMDGDTTDEDIKEVTREELINVSRCQTSHVKQLCDRGMLETYDVEVGRLNTSGSAHPELIKALSEAQQKAFDEIESEQSRPTLLMGVTGSGKTEIYIHLIQKALDEGKQVLYLLPEIALTVQIMRRLHRVFGDRLGIYHSKYSDAERVEIWQKQLSDHPYDVILGARSAVFLPFRNLGTIIIDEEHEQSFKQQDPAPRYHARSAALILSRMQNAKVVMGTATPSMESYANAMAGKYKMVQLTERYKGMQLPEIRVVDIADMQRRKLMRGPFSPQLIEAMRDALAQDKQVILFQNRRGWAPVVECRDCGWSPKCENCDVSLTMHRTTNQLSCHYCGYTYSIPMRCPSCKGQDIKVLGYGTEKIEELLYQLAPEIMPEGQQLKISRMDLDTTRTKNAYERIISEFSNGATNVLIGTQMVTKGLDFERVSVVGILSADTMLNYPDFRAYEHAYQMLAQVSGRAGRKGQRGLVLMQTKQPELPVVRQVVTNNYQAFYQMMSSERQLFSYPPYTRIIYVYLRHTRYAVVDAAATEMGSRLRQLFGSRVLGPDKPSVARVKQQCIRKIILKLEIGIDLPKVRQYLRMVKQQVMKDKRNSTLSIIFDVDPL